MATEGICRPGKGRDFQTCDEAGFQWRHVFYSSLNHTAFLFPKLIGQKQTNKKCRLCFWDVTREPLCPEDSLRLKMYLHLLFQSTESGAITEHHLIRDLAHVRVPGLFKCSVPPYTSLHVSAVTIETMTYLSQCVTWTVNYHVWELRIEQFCGVRDPNLLVGIWKGSRFDSLCRMRQ